MTAQRIDCGERGIRIELMLGGTLHILTLDEATELRDSLNKAVGEPVLTDREAMVWAAEFGRRLTEGYGLSTCAREAAHAVVELRNAALVCLPELTEKQSAMLAAMTGGGR